MLGKCFIFVRLSPSKRCHSAQQSGAEHGRSPDVLSIVSLEMSLVVMASHFSVFSISSCTNKGRKTFETAYPCCRAGCYWTLAWVSRQRRDRLKMLSGAFSVSDPFNFRSICPTVYLDTWLHHSPLFSPHFPTQG